MRAALYSGILQENERKGMQNLAGETFSSFFISYPSLLRLGAHDKEESLNEWNLKVVVAVQRRRSSMFKFLNIIPKFLSRVLQIVDARKRLKDRPFSLSI